MVTDLNVLVITQKTRAGTSNEMSAHIVSYQTPIKNIVNRAITIFCKHRIKNRCWIKYEGDPKVYWVALLFLKT